MNVISGLLQLGAVVVGIVGLIVLTRAANQAKRDREAALPKLDLSDVPPFLPDDEQ
ncbi:MAG: hypothetical protein OXU74_06390 [Gemmatimonadota bacterium]|nr:hypothetical protein [Gemmatimonadota bacterium]